MAIKESEICSRVKWIDITDPSNQEMESVSKEYNLHFQLVRDCMQPDHLPKFDAVDEVNFLILRYYSHSSDIKIATIQELSNKIAVFFTSEYLITIHKEPIQFLTQIHRKYIDKGKCSSSEEVVTKILWQALETFDDPG